jgi:hypothetical protein
MSEIDAPHKRLEVPANSQIFAAFFR